MIAALKVATTARRAAGVVVALLLADCAAQSLSPAGGPPGISAAHVDHRPSWMARDAKKKRQHLLYVSDDGTNDVYVYSYPQGALQGTLTGFSFPEGECVDKKGDIFVANNEAQTILEYAHGGATPIATLSDAGYFPVGCSVDTVTGNLAVANTYDTSFSSGSIAIYQKATGKPTYYTDAVLVYPHFCGYDGLGNLYLDGINGDFSFAFADLPKGSSIFTNVTLNQSIGFPGQVQWDGRYVAVADDDVNTIYQFTIRGTSGTKAGSTPLNGARGVAQFWIAGSKVIGPDTLNAGVGFWNYPAGGSEIKTISGLNQPFGATVSK
ncbi:MAG TPA: hypothetical protein VMT95_15290 [Candidatus Binatia bacterium]|nr:hypothetical protein [Candidatus Binatia bacterium]